jgi:cyclase
MMDFSPRYFDVVPKQKIIFGGDVISFDWMSISMDHGNVSNFIVTLHAITKLNPAIVLRDTEGQPR